MHPQVRPKQGICLKILQCSTLDWLKEVQALRNRARGTLVFAIPSAQELPAPGPTLGGSLPGPFRPVTAGPPRTYRASRCSFAKGRTSPLQGLVSRRFVCVAGSGFGGELMKAQTSTAFSILNGHRQAAGLLRAGASAAGYLLYRGDLRSLHY